MLTIVPAPSRLRIATSPPCRMALTRTGASPMPVPGRLRAAQPLASSCQSFISYGGSAVFADMIATGLLQSVPAAATAPSINRLPGF